MLTQNIYSLKLINVHSEKVNHQNENVLINYSVTLKTAIDNQAKNKDHDPELPVTGAQYVIEARKKDGTRAVYRCDNNEEVNNLKKVLDCPNNPFYH